MPALRMIGGGAPFLCLLCFVSTLEAQSALLLPWTKVIVREIRPKGTAPGHGNAVRLAALGEPTLIPATGPIDLAIDAQEPAGLESSGFRLNLTPPQPQDLFRFETEEKVRQRFRAYLKNFPQVEFPPASEATPARELAPRLGPHLVATAEPAYLCYQRLWFEQTNSERYGWSFGVLQPFISTGVTVSPGNDGLSAAPLSREARLGTPVH
jgi:hypothetical protein